MPTGQAIQTGEKVGKKGHPVEGPVPQKTLGSNRVRPGPVELLIKVGKIEKRSRILLEPETMSQTNRCRNSKENPRKSETRVS